jgi:plastocyanin
MRARRRRIALLLCGCAAAAPFAGGALSRASPTRWGQPGSAWDWEAMRARAHADARRHRCAVHAHARHRPKHCTSKPRHGASSTKPTAGPVPPGGGETPGGSEGLTPQLPGVPAPSGSPPPTGEEPAPPSIVHVQVVAVEYHYTLSRTTVPAGKVAIQFVDDGQDEHNLNVLSGEGEVEAKFPTTVSHGMREQTVNLRKGSFTLFCSLPEHEAKGMHATLTVQ